MSIDIANNYYLPKNPLKNIISRYHDKDKIYC